jgi:hypothetical protein
MIKNALLGIVFAVLTFGGVTVWKRVAQGRSASGDPTAVAPTRNYGCAPVEDQIRRGLASLPPEYFARMPLGSRAAAEKFALDNLSSVKRAVEALEPQLKPEYKAAKKCFGQDNPPEKATALLEWTLISTPRQIRLSQGRFQGTLTPVAQATLTRAQACVRGILGKSYQAVIATDDGDRRTFPVYSGPILFPVRFED